jgi:hypothetical protein
MLSTNAKWVPAVASALVFSLVVSGLGGFSLRLGSQDQRSVGSSPPTDSHFSPYVSPGLTLSPTSGPAGQSVSALASDFVPGELVELYFNVGSTGTCTADTVGNCTTTFTVPVVPGGSYAVAARGETSGLLADTTFVVTPTLTLSPTSGPAGTSVVAYATSFAAGEIVNVDWNGAFACSGTADSGGSTSCSFAAPAVSAGSYPVTAHGASSGETASATFALTAPTLTLSPTSGSVGESVSALVSDFEPSETVELYFNSEPAGTCTADLAGNCSATLTVPVVPGGSYAVEAQGETSGDLAGATFLVTPTLTLSPAFGPAGTSVVAYVTSFATGEIVNVDWSGGFACSGTANSAGSTSCSFTAPGVSAGSYAVSAVGTSSGETAGATFVLTAPTLVLSPTSGSAGQSVSARASDFVPGETVELYFNSGPAGTCTADTVGNCTTTFTVPVVPGGPYAVAAQGETSGDSASTTFLVIPTLALSPDSGPAGTSVVAQGVGFIAAETVDVYWAGVITSSAVADSAGTFSCTFTVPSTSAGTYAVTARGVEGDSANATFRVPPLALYAVTFAETGLPPSGKIWWVALGDRLQASSPSPPGLTAGTITFMVPNGTYQFLIRGPSGYRIGGSPNGSVVVSGGFPGVAVTFVRGSTPAIAFHELGLGIGTRWCGTLQPSGGGGGVPAGIEECSSTPNLAFKNMTPGTYAFSIGPVGSATTIVKVGTLWTAESNGVVTDSRGLTVEVRFEYQVTFTEAGLPSGTPWSVTSQGQTASSTTATIVLSLTNGSHPYHVHAVLGYSVSSTPAGHLTVSGVATSVSVTFTARGA